jgi:NAD(P)-dependent dehydrogenase (short-subunit alcohol dehydrogenase family)
MFKDSVWHKKIKKDKKKVNKIIQSNVPLNSFGSPDDISNMINYLISDKAKFINGSNFIIDGGQTIKI